MQKCGGGGRPGSFYHMRMTVCLQIYLGRQMRGGVPNRENELLRPHLALEFVTFAKRKMYCSCFKMKNACAKCILSIGDTVYLGKQNVLHVG